MCLNLFKEPIKKFLGRKSSQSMIWEKERRDRKMVSKWKLCRRGKSGQIISEPQVKMPSEEAGKSEDF